MKGRTVTRHTPLHRLMSLLHSVSEDERLRAAKQLGRNKGERVLRGLLNALTDKSSHVRSAAAESLGKLGGREAVDALRRSLRDPRIMVQVLATEALGELKARRAVSDLIQLLQRSGNSLVRVCAAESLSLIGDRRALPALVAALKDKHYLVRGYAAESLADFGGKSVINTLERALKKDRSSAARLRLYWSLYRLGKRDYFAKVLGMLGSKQYHVRCAAANILSTTRIEANAQRSIRALKEALRKEGTVAARSSMEASLRILKGVVRGVDRR